MHVLIVLYLATATGDLILTTTKIVGLMITDLTGLTS